MTIDREHVRCLLKRGDFTTLFIEGLGWDHYDSSAVTEAYGRRYTLTAIAEKRGLVAWMCVPSDGGDPPDSNTRKMIERFVAKQTHEHLIIFFSGVLNVQVWQWVKREHNMPSRYREHALYPLQAGESLIQKLESLTFTLDEEDRLKLTDVTARVRLAFDVERVTKRFYKKFREQKQTFLNFIGGIDNSSDCEWYASILLNRLMFVYFLQKKGFLDNNVDYLRNRLATIQTMRTEDVSLSFYRNLLLPLFHHGLGSPECSASLTRLLGNVPYLNGSLFEVHELEDPRRYGESIQIKDIAFESIFDFFDQYQWHLDDRPLRADNEINPDVLGYIFEKYINQKELGAYYTQEDITGYICASTILPAILDLTSSSTPSSGIPHIKGNLFEILQNDPDRYIHTSVRHGTKWADASDRGRQSNLLQDDQELPTRITNGLEPPTATRRILKSDTLDAIQTLETRQGWEADASTRYGHPSESWRDVVERHRSCKTTREILARKEINDIDEMITLNLDIRQFIQDLVESCCDPSLLWSYWSAVNRVTILDPTCGSGAFLFSALSLLEPIYEACIDRMEFFLGDTALPETFSPTIGNPPPPSQGPTRSQPIPSDLFEQFSNVLARTRSHPSRRYFVLKTIVLNNLYGVDIMPEAVEICKLRLFLKLASQVEPDVRDANLGIEPLPDIDFNIRVGNAIVGFTRYEDVEESIKSTLDFGQVMAKMSALASELENGIAEYRRKQIGGVVPLDKGTKSRLQNTRDTLQRELDEYLARDYGIDCSNARAYDRWLKSHRPFHWFVEYHDILSSGGFDVVIGNPPYIEYSSLQRQYTVRGFESVRCGNTYAYVVERSQSVTRQTGRIGMIVQLSMVCTGRMQPIRSKLLDARGGKVWVSNFDDRPARLFDGLEHIRASIWLIHMDPGVEQDVYSTKYLRWRSDDRDRLFSSFAYHQTFPQFRIGSLPKIGDRIGSQILDKIAKFDPLSQFGVVSGPKVCPGVVDDCLVYFHNAPQYWVRATDFLPWFENQRGHTVSSSTRSLQMRSTREARAVGAVLNSTLFYWWFLAFSDCRHLNVREIVSFPIGLDLMTELELDDLGELMGLVMHNYRSNCVRKVTHWKASGKIEYDEYYPKHAKSVIDRVDLALAAHFELCEAELDYILNYDIRFRLGG